MSKVEVPSFRFGSAELDLSAEAKASHDVQDLGGGALDARAMAGSGIIELELTVEVSATLLGHVLPPEELADPPVQLVIAEEGDRARRRRVHRATRTGPTTFTLAWRCDASNTYGELSLKPLLIRTKAGAQSPFAGHSGAILADGEGLVIYLDQRPPRAGNFLDIEYQSFSEGGIDGSRPELQEIKDHMYYLDTSNEDALLLLNADVESLQPILNSPPANRGRDKRIKEATFATITAHVWSQLAQRATHLLANEFHAEEAPAGSGLATDEVPKWARDVIGSLACELYDSPKLKDCIGEFEAELLAKPDKQAVRIDQVIQQFAKPSGAFRGLVLMKENKA